MMFTSHLFAQNTNPVIHYYYIEEASRDLLSLSNIVKNENGKVKALTSFEAFQTRHLNTSFRDY